MVPLQTSVVPAVMKSTLAAPSNDNFYYTHLKMLKMHGKFGGRRLGVAGRAGRAGNPAGGIDSKASTLATIIQILAITSPEKPKGLQAMAPWDRKSHFPCWDVPQLWDGARHQRDPA